MSGVAWLLLVAGAARAEELPACTQPDETSIYVLTIEPTNSVLRLFGHTALLDWAPGQGRPSPVYDYGHFSLPGSIVDTVVNYLTMQQKYFVAASDRTRTEARYRRVRRGIVAQRLVLTDEEAEELRQRLRADLADPEFRYNWYDQNCSTRVRDQLDAVLDGGLKAQMQGPSGTSPANEVLRYAADHPLWIGLAWGSTGVAWQEIPDWDAMFLPDPMRARLARATRPDGTPLVAETCQLVPVAQPPIRDAAPSRAVMLGILGLTVAGGLGTLSMVSRRAGLVAIGVVSGVAATWGAAALVVSFAGTFAPFWGDHQQAFASPLWGLLVAGAIIAARNPTSTLPRSFAWGLLGLGVGGLLYRLAFGAGEVGFALFFLPVLAAMVWGLRPE